MVYRTPYGSVQYSFPQDILTCFMLIFQDYVAGCFEFFAGLAEDLDKKQNSPVPLLENFKCHLRREPIGVVGLVTSWCVPFLPVILLSLYSIYGESL